MFCAKLIYTIAIFGSGLVSVGCSYQPKLPKELNIEPLYKSSNKST